MAMELLNFQMPPFTRTVFASKEAKDEWAVRLDNAQDLFTKLEQLSVKRGLRSCTTVYIPHDKLEEKAKEFEEEGLYFTPARKVNTHNGFTITHGHLDEKQPWQWFGALSSNKQDSERWVRAYHEYDHETMGTLLGYPECCKKFFQEKWIKGYIDPVWQQAENTHNSTRREINDKTIYLNNSDNWQSNQLLKYISIRLVPHISCSMDCKATQEQATKWAEIYIDEYGYDDDMKTVEEVLSMPVEWSALHGISYIVTPIFKIETNSVACHPKYTVQLNGKHYPEESATGLHFPFLNPLMKKTKAKC
jgi:hypothetical protein